MKLIRASAALALPLGLVLPAVAQPAAPAPPIAAPAPVPTAKPALQPPVPAAPPAPAPAPAPPQAVTPGSESKPVDNGKSASSAKPTPPAPVPPPSPLAVGLPAGMPVNGVTCVLDGLSIEDREISLMLIGLDFLNRGRYSRVAPENPIVNRLVQEAAQRCVQAYRWSPAASAAAAEYAHLALVREVVRQALDFEDRTIDPIETYYTGNRTVLVGKVELDDLMEEGFATHLIKAGWKESDREARRLARVYLETLIAQDRVAGEFTKAMTARPAPRPRARPARTASRGTP